MNSIITKFATPEEEELETQRAELEKLSEVLRKKNWN